MPSFNLSSNMSLTIPIVGDTAGPEYATDINNCLTLVDQHDHSPGYGVQITPSGLNINSDLEFNDNDATELRSARFQSQASPLAGTLDLDCLYASGVDLYYNDGDGNQIQITQNGGIAGSPGSISNLTSPASASYVSGSTKFVWQSDINTAADMDCGSLLLRNLTASSNALTLSPPGSLASNYTITLPTLPASEQIVTLDNSGNMSNWDIDSNTLNVTASTLGVKDDGIGYAQLAPGTIINRAYAELLTAPTFSTTIPDDDTIPQNTEGTQVMTCSITPKLSTSKLRVQVSIQYSCSDTGATQVVAMFRDSTANAICGRTLVNAIGLATMLIEVNSSSTSATTFAVRLGTNSGTLTINGTGGTRRLGGVARATMVIEEIKV
jgi:hypothetical protein